MDLLWKERLWNGKSFDWQQSKSGLVNKCKVFLNVFFERFQKTNLYQSSYFFGGAGEQEGETSFCCACKRGDFEMAQFLINKGANINFSLQRGVYSPTPIVIFSLSQLSKFSQLISETKEISFNSLFLVGLESFMCCSFGEWYQNGSFPSWKGC